MAESWLTGEEVESGRLEAAALASTFQRASHLERSTISKSATTLTND